MADRSARRDRRTWLALTAALLTIPLAAPPASAQRLTAATLGARGPAAATSVHRVTLLTGDTVTVTEVDAHHSTVTVDPADRVGAGAIRTTTVGGDVYVYPAVALPYLAAGLFDRALFNVTGLIEQGLTDDESGTVPLIVQYAKPASLRAQSAPLGSVRTRTLTSIDASAVDAAKPRVRTFWEDVTGTSPETTNPNRHPRLRDGIAKVWLDGRVQATLAESVAQIGAPAAWAAGYDGSGVTVAVLDSGIDADHPDLVDQIDDTRSFVPDETVRDVNGHGTHVASTVLGTGAASGGVERGVAPGARLLVGKVLGDDGYGQDSWIIDGMEWAATHADVVSMSLGSPQASDGTDPMSQALNALSEDTGTLFVVAAGNSGTESGVSSPAAADEALTVGAVDSTDALAWFSAMGPRLGDQALKPDIVAPGVDILAARSQYSAEGEGYYTTMSGTSMATPHVAGAAAVLAQRHPSWGAAQLKDALMSTAKTLGDTTPFQTGSGRVDVAAAALGAVTATGSVFFGFDRWPHPDESPVTRTVTYRNSGDDPVELHLDLDLRDNDGAPAPVGLAGASTTDLAVPAHGSASVDLTVDPSVGADGQRYLGRLSASAGGETVAHTTLGFVKEAERYDLTVTTLDRSGDPTPSYVEVVGGPAGYDVWAVDGPTTHRLPPGTYSLAVWQDVDQGTDHAGVALATVPEVTLDRDRNVILDLGKALPVTATAPVPPARAKAGPPLEATYLRMGWYRNLGDFPVESSLMMPVWIDAMYATPTAAVHTGEFELNTRWRLRDPLLTVRGPAGWMDVIAQAGAPFYDGAARLPVVLAGQGSTAEFDAVDAAGKIAIVTRNDTVSPYDRAQNAHAAGAALLLVVNDSPTELSEWVGGPNGEDPGIPVGSVSGTEGAGLLITPPATMRVVGTPNPDTVYDLQDPHPGRIPRNLAYRPKLRQLARVDGRYTSSRTVAGGEFRYDFRPYSVAGTGFLQVLSLPSTRTEWVSSPPGTTWYQEAMVVDPAWDVRGVRAKLRPGSRSTSTWFAPVVRPRIGEGYWRPTRDASFLALNLPAFADGGRGHTGDMYGSARQHIALYARGRLIAAADDQAMWPTLPSAHRLRYRLVTTATRDPARWRTSTRTTTTWRFWSARPAAGTLAYLPLLSLDYRVATDLAGRVGPGATRVRLSVVRAAGAADSGRVVGARLWASYDGGKHWRALELRAVGKASWTTKVPRRPAARGTVSLRATARDSHGNTVRQVVIGAYRLR